MLRKQLIKTDSHAQESDSRCYWSHQHTSKLPLRWECVSRGIRWCSPQFIASGCTKQRRKTERAEGDRTHPASIQSNTWAWWLAWTGTDRPPEHKRACWRWSRHRRCAPRGTLCRRTGRPWGRRSRWPTYAQQQSGEEEWQRCHEINHCLWTTQSTFYSTSGLTLSGVRFMECYLTILSWNSRYP